MAAKLTARSKRVPIASLRKEVQQSSRGCPVCHDSLTQGGKVRHLREQHSGYWRVLVIRVVSPWAFLALMFALATASAPSWSFIAALLGFVGLSLWARSRSALERRQRGLGLSGGQWLQGAGIGLILMSLAFAAIGGVFLLKG